MASTRISVGIRSRYRIPLRIEWSVSARPRAVAIAIRADGSSGSGATSGLRRISSIDGNCRNRRRKATSSVVAAWPDRSFEQLRFDLGGARQRSRSAAGAQSRYRTFEAISQERGVGHAFTSDVASASWRSAGLKRRKAMISGRIPALTAHLHQSMKSGSRSRWTKRLRSGLGIEKCTPRSEAGLPAAITTQPSGSRYSPSLRSSTS